MFLMEMAEKACWGLAAKTNIWFGTWKRKVAGLLMTICYSSTCYLFMVQNESSKPDSSFWFVSGCSRNHTSSVQGCGSLSGLDPDSIGSMDPDPDF